MHRLLICLAASLLALTAAGASATAQDPLLTETVIAGGDLPHPIRFAPVDADALTRRINDPPQLDEPPAGLGAAYSLSSPYWQDAAADFEAADAADGAAEGAELGPVDREALYYPEAGVARVTRGDDVAWLALDRRQQAIIQRYLRLGSEGRLAPEPGLLKVVAAAAASEQIAVASGGRTLAARETEALWRAAAGLTSTVLDPAEPPAATSDDARWLVVSLPEGRTVQLYYDSNAETLTDHLGVERYRVSDALADQLAALTIGPLDLPEDEGEGSPAWWLLLLGGGGGALSAAAWLQRRLRPGVAAADRGGAAGGGGARLP